MALVRFVLVTMAFWLVLQYPGDRIYTIMGPYNGVQCQKALRTYSKIYPIARCVRMKVTW